MRIRIANDLPSEMLEIIKNLNLSAIPISQHQNKLNELNNIISKYNVKKRTSKINAIEIDVPGGTQEAANLISFYDWNSVSKPLRMIAKPIIINYLKQNNLWSKQNVQKHSNRTIFTK